MSSRLHIDPYYVQEDDNLGEMAETLNLALQFADGDAVAPRTLFEATHDAQTAARRIGGTA